MLSLTGYVEVLGKETEVPRYHFQRDSGVRARICSGPANLRNLDIEALLSTGMR